MGLQEQPPVDIFSAPRNCKEVPYEVFFPHDAVGVERAKKICKGCPIIQQCLEYAIENREDFGVWGGTSERERRRIRKNGRI